jgi:hypothetical protein
VLLTRSRLCPRPKPGSSLHLHVLGTPPAFVLSQDQTLREELHERAAKGDPLHKESSRSALHIERWADPGRSLVGPGPCVLTRGSDVHQRIPGRKTGFQSGTVVNRRPSRDRSMRRRRTWTHSSTENRSKGAHAVEFSKTVAPLRKGIPSQGAPEIVPISERTGEYSARTAARGRRVSRVARTVYCPWLRHLGRPFAPEATVAPVSANDPGYMSRRSRVRRVVEQSGGRPPRHLLTTGPGRSPSAGGDDRRSRSARPAARSRVRGARRRRGSSPRARSGRREDARASCCRG